MSLRRRFLATLLLLAVTGQQLAASWDKGVHCTCFIHIDAELLEQDEEETGEEAGWTAGSPTLPAGSFEIIVADEAGGYSPPTASAKSEAQQENQQPRGPPRPSTT